MKFLIDGENFRHQIASVLLKHGKIKDKNGDFVFDFSAFAQEVLGSNNLEIIYYTTKIKQPKQKVPAKFSRNILGISNANRKWIARLSNQGITVVKAGNLRIRESNHCIHCGKKTLILQEKGVDVRVATDIVLASQEQESVAFGSSDSDLIPALMAVRVFSAELIYVCHSGQLNRSVAASVDKVVTFDDGTILKYLGS